MINEFIDSVVSQGAEALLPQFLTPSWLERLSFSARNFLCDITDDSHEGDPLDIFESEESNLLIISVTEIAHAQAGYTADFDPSSITEEDMAFYLKCYAMSVIYEYIKRNRKIPFQEPDINTIFDEERIMEIEQNDPRMTNALYDFMANMTL